MTDSLTQKELESKALVKSKIDYKGKVFKIRHDVVQIDKQPPHNWYIVVHPGAAAALPINNEGKIILIRQWRRAIGQIIYEIPAGTLDEDETPLNCIERELQEEIGYKATTFIPIGGYYPTPGFCDEYVHLFIAKDLKKSTLPKDVNEGIDVVELHLSEVLNLIDSNEIQDGKTISTILRYTRLIDA